MLWRDFFHLQSWLCKTEIFLKVCMCLLFLLIFDDTFRNLNYFGSQELCCIQYWPLFSCIHYLRSGWLHVCLHYVCFITIIAWTWNTLDEILDTASNSGNNLSAFVDFYCMYTGKNCCCYIIIDCTGKTLYSGKNTASNFYKLFGCIQYFLPGCKYFFIITLNVKH